MLAAMPSWRVNFQPLGKMRRRLGRPRLWALTFVLASGGLSACAPALNWREMPVADTGLRVQFPCKPMTHAKDATTPTGPARMNMLSCEAAGATFALLWLSVSQPSHVEPMLGALRQAGGAPIEATPPWTVVGATPHRLAARWTTQRPDAQANVRAQHVGVMARGSVVVQASVLSEGANLDAAKSAPFFDSLQWAPR